MSYQYRKLVRDKKLEQVRSNERARRQHKAAIKANALIKDYEAACKALGHYSGRVYYVLGWYYIDEREPVRAKGLAGITAWTWAAVHAKELDAPVDSD